MSLSFNDFQKQKIRFDINKLKEAFRTKEKDTSHIDNKCLLKLHEYLKMLDTQFDRQISNSIMISSILKS